MPAMSAPSPRPQEIASFLGERVVGQQVAVREMSVALSKKLAGLRSGNVLLIGSSGTGKTTLMRAVEAYLAARPMEARAPLQIRIHANVLAAEAEAGRPGAGIVGRLLVRARELAAGESQPELLLERVRDGIVFVDEVDKIRASVGGKPNVSGIRAQESLLTLIENEAVLVDLPSWAGGGTASLDAGGLLFVCAGAFEGLYDSVYDRVTVGGDRGALKAVTVVEEGVVREETRFELRDWLRKHDLFDYGMTPQFLSRFDSVVLLEDLTEDALVEIFLNSPESGYQQSQRYFEGLGLQLAVSPAAVRRIAAEAGEQPRLGARALNGVFRRVIGPFEFDPKSGAVEGALLIDLPEVEAALDA